MNMKIDNEFEKNKNTDADVIIIGAGPAGMTAAIYTSRAGLDTVLLEREAPGGKLLKTKDVENWPGIASGNGPDIAMSMFSHSTSFGAKYMYGDVVNVDREGEGADGPLTVKMADGSKMTADAVVVATGMQERLLGIPGERENMGRGVSFCAVCDGAFYRGGTVAVIGGGNSAFEEAEHLTQFADKVYIVVRRDTFRAAQIAVDRAMANEKIEIITKAVPVEIKDDGMQVNGLVIRHTDTDELEELKVDGVFPYIGSDPASDLVKEHGILDESGFAVTDSKMRTDIPGLFIAGDVRDTALRQIVTAAGDGAVAAQEALEYIRSLRR